MLGKQCAKATTTKHLAASLAASSVTSRLEGKLPPFSPNNEEEDVKTSLFTQGIGESCFQLISIQALQETVVIHTPCVRGFKLVALRL